MRKGCMEDVLSQDADDYFIRQLLNFDINCWVGIIDCYEVG